jgi:hypothetical protein
MASSVAKGRVGDLGGRSDLRGEVGRHCPDARLGDPAGSLRVLFLVSAHNSLSQRAWIALIALGHRVTVAVVDSVPGHGRGIL